MKFKVFWDTGEEIKDVKINTIEDLLDIINESPEGIEEDFGFKHKEIKIGVMKCKNDTEYGYIEMPHNWNNYCKEE